MPGKERVTGSWKESWVITGKAQKSKTVLPSRLLRVTLGCAAEVPSIELRVSAGQSRIHHRPCKALQTRKPPVWSPRSTPAGPRGPRPPPQAPCLASLAPRTWSLCHREGAWPPAGLRVADVFPSTVPATQTRTRPWLRSARLSSPRVPAALRPGGRRRRRRQWPGPHMHPLPGRTPRTPLPRSRPCWAPISARGVTRGDREGEWTFLPRLDSGPAPRTRAECPGGGEPGLEAPPPPPRPGVWS